MLKTSSLIAAAVLFATAGAASAATGMHYRYETPEENNARSAFYDRLLQTNMGFRHYRIRKECGPIDFSAALKTDCIQSFDQYEPLAAGYR